jgi:hypothetical protein
LFYNERVFLTEESSKSLATTLCLSSIALALIAIPLYAIFSQVCEAGLFSVKCCKAWGISTQDYTWQLTSLTGFVYAILAIDVKGTRLRRVVSVALALVAFVGLLIVRGNAGFQEPCDPASNPSTELSATINFRPQKTGFHKASLHRRPH